MRITIPLGDRKGADWSALRNERHFLYRRITDRDRAVLFVGEADVPATLSFDRNNAVDWYYGHIQYDLNEELEPIRSRHPVIGGPPLSHWAVPRWVIEWKGSEVSLHTLKDDQEDAIAFADRFFRDRDPAPVPELEWRSVTSRDRYLQQANKLLQHIQRGDIYEVNYCIARTASAHGFDPFEAFPLLLRGTDAAFAAFHRHGDRFALCASPERFLAFKRDRVIAQPMKGTRPRSSDPIADARLADELANDPKERSENIMALDVARHDLSRIAARGSVKVDELCKVHPHGKVHQMTSTVSAVIGNGHGPMDVVRAAFPMASMTGAPKYRAMQLIDEAEDRRRGLFSGTLGFFAPDGTADLNVVIRTIFFDADRGELSLLTGSALTAACDPEKEWEECELKARSVLQALRSC